MNKIITGDALETLRTLPDNFVQCCVTSPPYYGLRDYGTETIMQLSDGPQDCQHEWIHEGRNEEGAKVAQCKFCHAAKYDYQIGLEDTPQEYIAKLVEVFREVRRVLRSDGVLWLNIGDSYVASGTGSRGSCSTLIGKSSEAAHTAYLQRPDKKPGNGLKPKDLMMIPARVAIALQADGWYLRSDVIWSKPNCMPESVEDRPTKSHEYLFMLSKSSSYYYDADAIREPLTYPDRTYGPTSNHKTLELTKTGNRTTGGLHDGRATYTNPLGRNKRTVWTVPTQPYSEAHFATFPPKLIEPCILAGTSPRACEHCGAPWERVTVPTGHINKREPAHAPYSSPTKTDSTGWAHTRMATDQWKPTCSHSNTGSGKCIVLDPFAGAGTVPLVAIQHKRDYLGIELNPDYVALIERRIAHVQQGLWTEVPA